MDENGEAVALRGLSTHGLTWYPEFVNEGLFRQVSSEWDCNLIRLAMYSELYCDGWDEESLALVHRGIDAAIAADMYVLVDWHILVDNNPLENADQAAAFFQLISEEYADCPNIIYEICNEPNGDTSWADITAYAERIIPLIRVNDPDSVIIVGTPDFDRDVTVACEEPLPFDNVMYTLHFYAASHYGDLLSELQTAVDQGLPVFITECGLSEDSGDGAVDFENAAVWFSYLREHQLSFAVWSLSDKPEASALVREGSALGNRLADENLTTAGLWVRPLIQGEDPATISTPQVKEEGAWDTLLRVLRLSAGEEGLRAIDAWAFFAFGAVIITLIGVLLGSIYRRRALRSKRPRTYDSFMERTTPGSKPATTRRQVLCRAAVLASTLFTLIYLTWRVFFSMPFQFGWLAVAANIILLAVEILGFVESLVHYGSMMGMRERPLPEIAEKDFPEVDIFITTYNEPVDLLRRTVNGCTYLKYPDTSKVHVWICDDNRRPEMRALAEELGVGYLDRPDNEGAKAGNLNHAMSVTSAPYVVTLDADMIPKSDFLMKTIPYFVDVEQRNETLPEDERVSLGLLQTPQCFYEPDVFQHALYSEHNAPNEQDFFYRTIEPAKTSSNSVIYGGSNTVLSRKALDAVGGFYTGSITEDFATGMLIESAGFISLAISEPLASGRTPNTFREHIQQRTRWGRGVIVTARKLKLLRRKGLTLSQKSSYWSSVVYWYSPVKNLVYLLSPLLFSVFALPVFRCSWVELLAFWLPMFIMQDITLRLFSSNSVSSKWSGIYETCVMPQLFIPFVKEFFGITLSSFKVTDKSGNAGVRKRDWRSMAPFLVLLVLSVLGIIRTIFLIDGLRSMGLIVLLFWLIRNLYFLIMALFLIDGRDSDGEVVNVQDSEPAVLCKEGQEGLLEGVTTHLTERSVDVFLDEAQGLTVGDAVRLQIDTGTYDAELQGTIKGIKKASRGEHLVCKMEITGFAGSEREYLQILYDRVPTLPQSLTRDFGIIRHLARNIRQRMAR